jgi:ubiquinone/menaquinone biosynthesis C-methylase UbiE
MGEKTFKGYAADFFQNYYFRTESSKVVYFDSIQCMIDMSQINEYVNPSVLDLGCGNGILLNTIKGQMNTGSYFGIDNSKDMIDLANTLDKSIRFSIGDVNKTDFQNDQFDFVFTRAVMQHLDDPQNMLSEAFRVLKTNGKLILLIPVKSLFGILPRYFAKIVLRKSDQVTGNQYWPSEVLKAIIDSGLVITKKKKYGGLFYAVSGYGSGIRFPVQNSAFWESLVSIDRILVRSSVFSWIGLNLIVVAQKK